jgi:hypothetical protein
LNNSISSSNKLLNSRFDFSELRDRVKKHEAIRRDPSSTTDYDTNRLLHSMDSLNQQNRHLRRSKLPPETYAPWLKLTNMTSQAFHEEIQ